MKDWNGVEIVAQGQVLLPDIGTTPVVLTLNLTLDQADALRHLLAKSPRDASEYTGLPIERWLDRETDVSWKGLVHLQLSHFVDRVRMVLANQEKP